MFKKISALSAVGFALFAMSGCSDDSSSSGPSIPPAGSAPTCTAKKTSSNTVEMVLNIPGISSSTITTTIDGNKAFLEIYSIYSSSVPESVFQKECEENKREAEDEHDNATVTCKDRTLKITSEEDAEGSITIDRLLESSQRECANFESMYKDKVYDFDEEDDAPANEINSSGFSDPDHPYIPDDNDTPLLGNDNSDNRPGKATCRISQNTDTNFEMIVSDADTATMFVYMKYVDGNVEENSITIFNESLPQSFIDQECAEAREEALEDDDGTVVTCEGNTVSQSFMEEYPFNPIPFVRNELVATCNDIQETGIIPDDEL